MKIERIYENNEEHKELIHELEDDRKIIRRSPDTIRKFKLNEWDDINFIPEGFQETGRDITPEEEEELKRFLEGGKESIWQKIKKRFSGRGR